MKQYVRSDVQSVTIPETKHTHTPKFDDKLERFYIECEACDPYLAAVGATTNPMAVQKTYDEELAAEAAKVQQQKVIEAMAGQMVQVAAGALANQAGAAAAPKAASRSRSRKATS